MSSAREIDLALGLLDHQLVDCDGRRCDKADDLELTGLTKGGPRVVAILVGPRVWRGRGLLGRLAAFLSGGRTVHVLWSEVADVGASIELRRTAHELRLGSGDDRSRALVDWIPGS